MKRTLFTVILILSVKLVTAQKVVVSQFAVIDKKVLALSDSSAKTTKDIADYITANFTTDNEKVRAIFAWVTANIEYDVENMFAINFYENREEKITKALKSRKGVCDNYAYLFSDICAKSGIKSFVVEGYTKQNGVADYVPHAWCAAIINNEWFMFDPTWGSGYISNGRFYKKINNTFFKASPATLIRSHMPFDYLWQFLNYPVTNQEFYDGKTVQSKSKPFFSYIDSIKAYEQQSNIEQLMAASGRIEKNGVRNSLIFDRLQHLKLEIENDRQNKSVNLYNAAVADYNSSINDFNAFIQYRNKQFQPAKPDNEIQSMIDSAKTKVNEAGIKLRQIKNADANLVLLISQLNKSINDFAGPLKEQQEWLTLYFSKGKSKRKSMFYDKKITWFGIPIK